MTLQPLRCIVWATAAALLAASAQAEVSVNRYDFGIGGDTPAAKFEKLTKGSLPGGDGARTTLLVLGNEKMAYHLVCWGPVDPDTGDWQASIGMPKPSKANWYRNKFFRPRVHGSPIWKKGTFEVVGTERAEGVASATVRWRSDRGALEVSFRLHEGDDKLLVETTCSPAEDADVDRWSLRLIAYPSSYAGGFTNADKHADRVAMTANRRFAPRDEGPRRGELTAEERWLLLYDRTFDTGREENLPEAVRGHTAEGPCAFAYVPDEASRVRVGVAHYACQIALRYPAERETAHLFLWDLHGMTNDDAIGYMEALRLREVD